MTKPAGPVRRAASAKQLVPNILHDQKSVWLYPVRLSEGQHWKPTLVLTLATAGLVALDPHDTPYFRRTSRFIQFNNAVSGRNTALAMMIFPGSVYGAGLWRHDQYAAASALMAGEAAADSELLALIMKNIDRRLRPSDIPPDGDFSHTWFKSHGPVLNGRNAGFPSGHSIGAFSLATVFACRYREHRWVPWVAYGLAGLVGFSRITTQAHFPSDVFVGAALGYAIGQYVSLRQ